MCIKRQGPNGSTFLSGLSELVSHHQKEEEGPQRGRKLLRGRNTAVEREACSSKKVNQSLVHEHGLDL